MADNTDLLDVLTDKQKERLKDGEEIEFLVGKTEPLIDHNESQSMDVLTLTWNTKGVVNGSLEEHYPDVVGLGSEE